MSGIADVRTSWRVYHLDLLFPKSFEGKFVQQCCFVGRFPPLQSWVAWAEREEEEEEEEGQEDIKVTFTFLQQFRLRRRQRTRNDRGETAKDKGGGGRKLLLSLSADGKRRWVQFFPFSMYLEPYISGSSDIPPLLPRGSKVQV